MCGIAGTLGIPLDIARPAAERMVRSLHHRGPDDRDIVVVPDPLGREVPAVLVHTRLAIVDLTPSGHQPMCDVSRDGERKNWVVFNGEIFNYADLHEKLALEDWPCGSRSDTEVILKGYRVFAERSVERYRGMFAWCLLDGGERRAWFVRDRLGIKPLYFYRPPSGGLVFASEIRTLLASELVPRVIRPCALESYLAQGAVYEPDTILDGVEMLPPGAMLTTDWAGRTIDGRRYWSLSYHGAGNDDSEVATGSRADAVTTIGQTLRDAVKMRLVADVPVGLFLSGGIDSTAVTTIATEVNPGSVRTISIGFDQPEFDETDAAAAIAKQLGTDHRMLRLTGGGVLDDFATVLAAIDQPTVDGFNTYFVSREARRAGLTVALSGVGGDELFGGYASFRDVPRAKRWRTRLGWAKAMSKTAAQAAGLFGRGAVKMAAILERPASSLHAYFVRRELFMPADRRDLFHLPSGSDAFCGIPAAAIAEMNDRAAKLDDFNQVSLFEVNGYLRNMLLRDADVFSMASSLELRVPLLDHKLVESVAALPGRWKFDPARPKSVLLDAVGPRLPAQVATMPKRGFTFPWEAWLRGTLKPTAEKYLINGEVWGTLGFDPQGPARLWKRFEERDRRVSPLQILALIVLGDFGARHGLRRAG
jgi:asparagine synthase (glutamine-hydrolysing)